jgi:hypothetical protein
MRLLRTKVRLGADALTPEALTDVKKLNSDDLSASGRMCRRLDPACGLARLTLAGPIVHPPCPPVWKCSNGAFLNFLFSPLPSFATRFERNV